MAENMIKAGRAGLTFGGDWDETVEYNRLVGVRYDNKLFFSKKTVPVGTIPEDGEYWFLSYEGLTDEQYEALLNGTQQVGDSAKLGGKAASEYATDEEIKNNSIWNDLTEGFDLNNALGKYRTASTSIVRSLLNKPADLTTGEVTVEWFPSYSKNLYGMQIIKVTANKLCKTFIRARQDTWGEWDSYLPLSGGRLDSKTATVLGLNAVENDVAFLQFLSKAVNMGHLGFSGVNKPVFRDASSNYYDLLHTGNKPTGTYTGNGDATARTISIGGVGKTVLVRKTGDSTNFAIVSENGYIGKQGNTVVVGEDAKTLYAGDLWVKSTSDLFNASGASYYYEKL